MTYFKISLSTHNWDSAFFNTQSGPKMIDFPIILYVYTVIHSREAEKERETVDGIATR